MPELQANDVYEVSQAFWFLCIAKSLLALPSTQKIWGVSILALSGHGAYLRLLKIEGSALRVQSWGPPSTQQPYTR